MLRNKFIKVLLLSLFYSLLTTTYVNGVDRKYAFVHLKYKSLTTPLKVKVLPFTEDESTSKFQDSDHVMVKKNSGGLFQAFLAYKFPNEKEGFKPYKYKILFYNNVLTDRVGNRAELFAYGMTVIINSAELTVIYDSVHTPQGPLFNNKTKKYRFKDDQKKHAYIKDWNDRDFDLSKITKEVTFLGRVSFNGSSIKFKKLQYPNMLSLLFKEEQTSHSGIRTNYGHIKELIIPLYQKLIFGPYPYEINCESKRYALDISNNNKILNIAELPSQKNEKKLYFTSKNKYLDVFFDTNNYNVELQKPDNTFIKVNTSPFSIFLDEYLYKNLSFSLNSHTHEKNYLSDPEALIVRKKRVTEEDVYTLQSWLLTKYPELITTKNEQHEININPVFKHKPFAVFTVPDNAEIKFQRLNDLKNRNIGIIKDMGTSPTYHQKFNYGLYKIQAMWKDLPGNPVKVITVEISDQEQKSTFYPISLLKKGENIIPYITIRR